MRADDVTTLLRLLSAAGVRCWVDGGWGVDALLGLQTRSHGDLDLVVHRDDLASTVAVLAGHGYQVLRDLLPTALALGDPDGREVDLHPVDPTPDGGGEQVVEDGTRFRYAAPVVGSIGGDAVLCLSVADQLRTHVGYPPRESDRADLHLLAQRFAVELPAPYA